MAAVKEGNVKAAKRAEWWAVRMLAVALAGSGCSGTPEAEADRLPAVSGPTATEQLSNEPAAATPEENTKTLEILSVLSVEKEVDVLAQRDGVVVQILHDQGSRVRKGAVLARLDAQDLLAQLDRARADLQVAQSNVKYNEAEVKARQAAYRRAQEMRKVGLNSDTDLEEAEFRAKGAEYDLESWHAVVARTEADLRILQLELAKTRIRPPFTGVITRRYIRLGQNVLKDGKCFRVSELFPLQVRFLVPETAARRPQVGELVDIVPVADSRRVYAARIRSVSPTVDAASGSYDITAQLTEPDLSALRPGMAVSVLWAFLPLPGP